MAFTYEWSVESLKVKDEVNIDGETNTNAVVQTFWRVKGTDANGNVGEFAGATPFTAANVPAGTFTAFEDLTEAAVIGWIKAVVNGSPSYKAHIDEQIQLQIDKENEEEVTPSDLPWASGESVTPDPEALG